MAENEAISLLFVAFCKGWFLVEGNNDLIDMNLNLWWPWLFISSEDSMSSAGQLLPIGAKRASFPQGSRYQVAHQHWHNSGVKAFVEKKGETLYNIFLTELNHNIKKEFDQFRRGFIVHVPENGFVARLLHRSVWMSTDETLKFEAG